MRTVTQYFSDDGKQWDTYQECFDYETKLKLKKHGLSEFTIQELTIGKGVEIVDCLPCEAPWFGPLGACLVKIYEVKREDGIVIFGVGNENGRVISWVKADDFYIEWPQ